MYTVQCISSGVIVARFADLKRAKWWVEDNNILDGEYANLFRVVKVKA